MPGTPRALFRQTWSRSLGPSLHPGQRSHRVCGVPGCIDRPEKCRSASLAEHVGSSGFSILPAPQPRGRGEHPPCCRPRAGLHRVVLAAAGSSSLLQFHPEKPSRPTTARHCRVTQPLRGAEERSSPARCCGPRAAGPRGAAPGRQDAMQLWQRRCRSAHGAEAEGWP